MPYFTSVIPPTQHGDWNEELLKAVENFTLDPIWPQCRYEVTKVMGGYIHLTIESDNLESVQTMSQVINLYIKYYKNYWKLSDHPLSGD